MNSVIQKGGVGHFHIVQRNNFLISLSTFVLTIISGCFSNQVSAGTVTNEQFRQYVKDISAGNITAPSGVIWDLTKLSTLCTNAASAIGGANNPVTANLGTSDALNQSISSKNKDVYECLDDFKAEPGKKGCATGGWGMSLSVQAGRSNRQETELENGFQSDLKGLLIGLDYSFSDSFILGTSVSQTSDDAAFINNAGSLKTSNNILSIYSTWLPSEKLTIDGYLSYGAINYDSQRQIIFGTAISGTATGNTSGRQTIAGVSTAYQYNLGSFNVSPFINLDYIKTDIKGYNENGTTYLELHYGDRTTISSTASLGTRASKSYGFDWGNLTPIVHFAGVHEFQNNSTQINNELVLTPGAGILVSTDAPDRDYFLSGLGVSAALNNRAQLFLNYERRSGDSYLDSWVVSLGLTKEF